MGEDLGPVLHGQGPPTLFTTKAHASLYTEGPRTEKGTLPPAPSLGTGAYRSRQEGSLPTATQNDFTQIRPRCRGPEVPQGPALSEPRKEETALGQKGPGLEVSQLTRRASPTCHPGSAGSGPLLGLAVPITAVGHLYLLQLLLQL